MSFRIPLLLILTNFITGLSLCALTIDPLGLRLKGQAGTILSGTLSLRNEKTETKNIEIITSNFSNSSLTHSEWLKLSTDRLLLEPNERKELYYTIHIPKDARGQLMAKVSFQAINTEAKTTSVLNIRTRISVYFIAVIEGTEVYDCTIQKVALSTGNPKELLLTILNTGNVYIKSQGTAIIKEITNGTIVAHCPVNKKSTNLYPQSPRRILAELENPLPPGEYELELTLESTEENFTIKKTAFFTIASTDTSND